MKRILLVASFGVLALNAVEPIAEPKKEVVTEKKSEFDSKFEDITSKKLENIEKMVKNVNTNQPQRTMNVQPNSMTSSIKKEKDNLPVYLGGYTIKYKEQKLQKAYIKDSNNNEAMVVPGKSIVKSMSKDSITLKNKKMVPLVLNESASNSADISIRAKTTSKKTVKPVPRVDIAKDVKDNKLPTLSEAVERAKEDLKK